MLRDAGLGNNLWYSAIEAPVSSGSVLPSLGSRSMPCCLTGILAPKKVAVLVLGLVARLERLLSRFWNGANNTETHAFEGTGDSRCGTWVPCEHSFVCSRWAMWHGQLTTPGRFWTVSWCFLLFLSGYSCSSNPVAEPPVPELLCFACWHPHSCSFLPWVSAAILKDRQSRGSDFSCDLGLACT